MSQLLKGQLTIAIDFIFWGELLRPSATEEFHIDVGVPPPRRVFEPNAPLHTVERSVHGHLAGEVTIPARCGALTSLLPMIPQMASSDRHGERLALRNRVSG